MGHLIHGVMYLWSCIAVVHVLVGHRNLRSHVLVVCVCVCFVVPFFALFIYFFQVLFLISKLVYHKCDCSCTHTVTTVTPARPVLIIIIMFLSLWSSYMKSPTLLQ